MGHTQVWLTVEQISAHLQVSKETVYRWLDCGRIPAHRVGKQWRFLTGEVDEWVLSGGAGEMPKVHGKEAEHE
jgi:excisionase family DNA binding protein